MIKIKKVNESLCFFHVWKVKTFFRVTAKVTFEVSIVFLPSPSPQFKCGVFFMDLHGQSERLRWIAALPDALVKPSLRNSPVLMRSIGNVSKRDFTVPKGDCDVRAANNECLDIVS